MLKDTKNPVTLRSVLIGFVFVVVLCGVTPYNNDYLQNALLAGNHLPVASIFVLLFLVFCINVPLRKLRPKSALTATELTTSWIMLIATLAIPGIGFMEILFPQLVAVRYFATPENEWAETLQPHMPDWLVVTDKTAVREFYESDELTGAVPWAAWIRPILSESDTQIAQDRAMKPTRPVIDLKPCYENHPYIRMVPGITPKDRSGMAKQKVPLLLSGNKPTGPCLPEQQVIPMPVMMSGHSMM